MLPVIGPGPVLAGLMGFSLGTPQKKLRLKNKGSYKIPPGTKLGLTNEMAFSILRESVKIFTI
jgi:hypothetical protein